MNRISLFIRWIISGSFVFAIICGFVNRKNDDLIKVLILSGKNNHEWQKTTPVLVKMYNDSRLFRINITEMPETLTYKEPKIRNV